MISRLATWKGKLPHWWGDSCCDRVIVSTGLSYFMSIFKFLNGFIITNSCQYLCFQKGSSLECQMRVAFLWKGKGSVSGLLYLKNGNTIYHCNEGGGLGIKYIKNINVALLAQWVWKLLVGSGTRWSNHIESYYHSRRRFRMRMKKRLVKLFAIWKDTCKDLVPFLPKKKKSCSFLELLFLQTD